MGQIGTSITERKVTGIALEKAAKDKVPVLAIELNDGTIITGKQTYLLTATSAALLNSIKHLAGIKDKLKLVSFVAKVFVSPLPEIVTA